MNRELIQYYGMLILGIITLFGGVIFSISTWKDSTESFKTKLQFILITLFGVGLLYWTVPSLTQIVFKNHAVIKGDCYVEENSGKTHSISIIFDSTEDYEDFTFLENPELGAYGEDVPYYCRVISTKNHQFPISYKIYDSKTHKQLSSSKDD